MAAFSCRLVDADFVLQKACATLPASSLQPVAGDIIQEACSTLVASSSRLVGVGDVYREASSTLKPLTITSCSG